MIKLLVYLFELNLKISARLPSGSLHVLVTVHKKSLYIVRFSRNICFVERLLSCCFGLPLGHWCTLVSNFFFPVLHGPPHSLDNEMAYGFLLFKKLLKVNLSDSIIWDALIPISKSFL